MTDELRVLALTPTHDEAIKPSELIQITGHQQLTLNARRAITVLWHNAHRQGIKEGRDYTIELADLRPDAHKGSEMVEEAILSLMQTILTVRLSGNRTRRVQFLGGNDMDDPSRPSGVLTYSFDKRLVEMLRDSSIWGRIALPVLMAFSSKYAVSLYENASQWTNLSRKVHQDFPLEQFRQLLGVEDGKYPAFGALNKHVLKPVMDEINALAPFNLSILPMKTGKKVTGIRIGWWRKNEDELRAAWAETQRPKVGRRARISGRVEHVSPLASVGSMARKER
ncbi:replication initiation protein [Oceaniglobus ichthyenteri]|uniref:replication initiation protein n=1 Tax=Oceaniglobus ichthyenteri TaxID=2136177 RepID=UPI000D3BC1E3|nr:replication initiation protein [Oceaniglobus ichthyenteri]